MADYPDHLNPFRSRGLRESFRSAKRSLIHTFRKKKDVVSSDGFPRITGAAYEGTILRAQNQQVANGTQRPETEVFPRSRFNERVARAQTLPVAPKDNDATNPFSESSANEVQEDSVKNGTYKRRRRKKRAPLPPGRENLLTVPGDHQNSQWSLASNETDCSSIGYAHSEVDFDIHESPDTLRDIHEIAMGIQLLCADEDHMEKATIIDDVNHDVSTHASNDKINSSSCDTVEVMTEASNVEKTNDDNVDNEESTHICDPIHQETNDAMMREISVTDNAQGSSFNCEVNNNNKEITEVIEISDEAKCSVDKTCDSAGSGSEEERRNVIDDEQVTRHIDQVNDEAVRVTDQIDGIHYVERESIYIYGSDDNVDGSNELKFNESALLFIKGSNDQLESIDDDQPTMKMSQNEQTKSASDA